MFPLRLIIYEVVNHEEGLFDFFLKQILTKSMKGTAENLFGMLFPKLINVAIPLSEVDILYLKSLQVLQNSSSDIFRGANIKDFSTHLDKSTRTVLRRIKLIEFFQIDIPMHFLDMAKLGYETFLLSHFQPVPDNLTPYCYNSVDLSISQFSLFQVPVSKPNVFMQIQNDLEPIIFQQMDTRIQNWNLSGLGVGKDGWKIPPSFLYSDPSLQIITASPAMEVSLRPDLETFRKLTPADIKILEFITTTGALRTRKDLSQAVKVSSPQISHRLDEYLEERLIFKIHQFFNIGLDLTISFCITCPDSYNIAWIPHFLSFPKVDIFFSKDEQGNMFFGHVKLPPKWIKDFILKVRMLKQEFKALKFYYTAEPPTIGKWSTSLSDTYF
ncbi:MAG: hypothetical protein JSV04_06135 [Candidatus Heimdallarchaeota archaeon]|nr:MAG: hypothetical protein JSV04_06135 [Candidatus Heimdallarchaeota archaeon]